MGLSEKEEAYRLGLDGYIDELDMNLLYNAVQEFWIKDSKNPGPEDQDFGFSKTNFYFEQRKV